MRRVMILCLMLTALAAQAEQTEQTARTASQVLDCAASNSPAKTFMHQVSFTTINAEGTERVLRARVLGERAEEGLKLNLRVTEPPALAKTTILVRERDGQDDMRIFLPAAQRTQRVTGSMAATRLLGTDFSYQDLKQMFGAMLDGEASYLESAELHGRSVDRLRLVPAAEEAAPYDEVIVAFDRETCVPLQGLFQTEDGQLLRQLEADHDSLTSLQEHNYARVYTLEDLISQSRTRVELSQVEYDERLPNSAFHPVTFKNVD